MAEESIKIPSYMRAAARRGLQYHADGKSGSGLVPQTVADARRMADEGTVSETKVRKIGPWIARHMVDLDAPSNKNTGDSGYPGAGLVAHLLWGSGPSKTRAQAAMNWANRQVAMLDKKQSASVVESETLSTEGDIEMAAIEIESSDRPLVDELGTLLADAATLYLSAHGAHWNVSGSDFSEYHSLFSAIYEDVWDSLDDIAENIRKLDGLAPFGLVDLITRRDVGDAPVETSPDDLCESLYGLNEMVIARLNSAFAVATTANQQGIANFLADRIDHHQKWSWQLKASMADDIAEDAAESAGGEAEIEMPEEESTKTVPFTISSTTSTASTYANAQFTFTNTTNTFQVQQCPECGEQIPAGSTTCPECGAELLVEPEDDKNEDMSGALPMWESELAYEGMPTSDGRYLIPGKITNRDLPLSLMCQTVTADGHSGAMICGKVTRLWRVDRPDLGDGVVAIMGAGEFSDNMMGPEAARLVKDQVLRGVSVDISPSRRCLLDADTREEVSEDAINFEKMANNEYLIGIEGEIMGATMVPFPAFADATMRISAGEESITASAGNLRLLPNSITASAAGMAPIAPPKDWFFMQEPEGKCPLTVTNDGRIYGHLATWDQCHQGFANECVLAKPSRTDYAFFHVGSIKTKEGDMVNVGRIVVGESGHASLEYGINDTTDHYDKTGLVGAFVRAVDGKYGIWLSGAVRSDCPAERVRDMLANPPSGDWRRHDGWLELIAALSVPVPGFPVPRYEYAITASAESMDVRSLVATGYYEVDPPSLSRSEMRKKELLLREVIDR